MRGNAAAPHGGAALSLVPRALAWHAFCETTGVATALSTREVDLVRRSWRAVQPVGDTAAELFYGKLFSLAPEIGLLFTGDLRDQGRNLTAMISVAVHWLDKPERVQLALRQLGLRHAAYGVRARHYQVAEAALLWMLGKTLGEAFTPEVHAAWRAAFAQLVRTMQDGCRFEF